MKISREGEDLVDRWQKAKISLKRAESSVSSAQCEVTNATNALSKFLLPKDATRGEKYCVWFGDSLIAAEVADVGDPIVTIRLMGRSLG